MRTLESIKHLFPYLFLGHLVGDYVLQNSYIAMKKNKDIRVLLLHTAIVFLSQLFFISGKDLTLKSFGAILMLSVVHFFIDTGKFLCKKRFCQTWYYYLIDQSFHVVTLLITAIYLGKTAQPFFNRFFVVLLSVALFNGYFLSILVHFITSKGIYKRDYMGYLMRMVAPIFYILNIYAFVIYALACLIFVIVKPSKSIILNYLATIVSTIILLEVML